MPLGGDSLGGVRVVVVGAGVMGAAISYRLAQAGAEVTTVERRYPGGGTTSASFAILNAWDKSPASYLRLHQRSIEDHARLAAEVEGGWLHADGAMHWVDEADGMERVKMERLVAGLRAEGVTVEAISPREAMQIEPDLCLDAERVARVYVVPSEGWVDAVGMCHSLLHAAGALYGARVEHAAVVGLVRRGARVEGVMLDNGRQIAADVVVNAAGPDAGRIAALAGQALPLGHQVGVTFNTAPAPCCLRHLLRLPDLVMRPDGSSRLLIHPAAADQHAVPGRPMPLDAPVVQEALARVRALLPGLAEVPLEAARVGVRPMPHDGHPLVGRDPAVPGLYTAVTHSAVVLCARLALLIAQDLAGQPVEELNPYAVVRDRL